MLPDIEQAIKEIREAFPSETVEAIPDEQGGADVIVIEPVIGDQYSPSKSWIGFHIDFNYPRTDVYPHYLDSAMRRHDGRALGEGFSGPSEWRKRQAWQISRKSKRWDAATDTAAIKLAQVIEWVRSR